MTRSIKMMRFEYAGWREQLRRFCRIREDRRGIAAVEFALILPFMILLYLGTAELTYGLMANRKMTIAARTLSDLVAQTSVSSSSPTGAITDTDIDTIFTAARSVLSPFDLTPLRMSFSSVEFVPNSATPPVYTARTKWTAVYSPGGVAKGTPRPCGASAITKVANAAKPTSSTLPEGLYGAGTVIVADVSYDYKPPFSSSLLAWSTTEDSINFTHTTYMKPRTQTEIAYTSATPPAGRTKCTYP